MANQQVATITERRPVDLMKQDVAKMQAEFGKALPGHISADKFVRTAQTAIALTRNIEKANRQSLIAECTKAAADGLILDGREAALVIDYNGNAQYRPMMRGLLKLAYNSGSVKSVSVQIVCENDEFEYLAGDEERITHKVDFRGDRGKPFAVYGIAHLSTGEVIREVMTVVQINQIRDRSDAWKAFMAKKIKSTPWATDWEEMARKTVFRRLSKYLPSSSDRFSNAAERIDDDYTFDPPTYDNDPADPTDRPSPQKKRGGAAAALKDVTPKQDEKPSEPQTVEQDEGVEEYDEETGEYPDPNDPRFQSHEQLPEDDI